MTPEKEYARVYPLRYRTGAPLPIRVEKPRTLRETLINIALAQAGK